MIQYPSPINSNGTRYVCTSGTRPLHPFVGMEIYETNTRLTLQWDGSGWVVNWIQAWGEMGRVDNTATTLTPIITQVDVPTLTLSTPTSQPAGRKIRITAEVGYVIASSTTRADTMITDASNNILAIRFLTVDPTGGRGSGRVTYDFVSSGGVQTFKVRTQRGGGTGTLSKSTATGDPSFILMEDMGPAYAGIGGASYPVNTSLSNYVICTSSTRPTSPISGMQIYESDTRRTLVYDGTLLGWYPPWNGPWGIVGLATKTTNSALPTLGYWDVAGAIITYNSPPGRRLRLSTECYLLSGAAQTITMRLMDGVTQIGGNGALFTSGASGNISLSTVFSPAAGSKNYNLQSHVSTGTATLQSAASYPLNVLLEDLGPA